MSNNFHKLARAKNSPDHDQVYTSWQKNTRLFFSANDTRKEEKEKGKKQERLVDWNKWVKRGIILFILISLIFWVTSRLAGLPKTKEDNGRINLVFLGVSGNGQKPADLTDTIIFSSFNKKTGGSFILSLPRDIWLDSLKAKINTAYHYGGFELVRNSVQEILGQPVHYLFVLDFEGFKKVVDFLGGIEILVERTFDDYKYPIPGKENDECDGDKEFKCRYEHLHFESGWEKMNGEMALKYVRSRNAEGDEGTDFARNQRQQKFLLALKNRITKPDVFLNPKKITGLLALLPSLLKTNLTQEEYSNFGLSFLRFKTNKMEMKQLNGEGETGFLYHPTNHSSGQWVVAPKEGNWEKVKKFVKDNLP